MIDIWGITDVGLVRRENQDAYKVRQETASGHAVCVVCDGMGGTAGGRQASHIAAETFVEALERLLRPGMTAEELKTASALAVSVANQAVQEAAASSLEYQNMGTTLVSAVSFEGGMVICNVGDSRAYRLTPQGITRITRDHSLVEHMVERGDITAEEARRHPNRNVITRALGPDEDVECDTYLCPMEPGDWLLLCTDGLVNTVTDQEMWDTVLHGDEKGGCLNRLLEISKSRGASDNVTVVLMRRP
ncbi:MAG: Stp1/IreP family PP2C-type Ser/Thr phosphatase [Oscillibacter sp.]|nr:Stp1/IreP family PP2C-type Ser/Thr phosphatase [Oscillibacter sp.]